MCQNAVFSENRKCYLFIIPVSQYCNFNTHKLKEKLKEKKNTSEQVSDVSELLLTFLLLKYWGENLILNC